MKIRSVDVIHEGDGTESTSSDTLESTGSTLIGQSSQSGISKSDMSASQDYEKTIGSFAVAMTELHADLRDKTNECEALYETAHNLSEALQESDRLLQEKTLECERLLLKLQMVTFVERSDESEGLTFLEESYYDQKDEEEDYTIPQRPAAILDNIAAKYGGKKVLSKPRPETIKSRKAMTLESAVVPLRRAPSIPVSVDDQVDTDSDSDNNDDSDDRLPMLMTRTVDRNSALSAGPRQAHFYHVIVERDMAVQTNKKMSRELIYTRAKIRDLRAKLERSTALVELSYTAADMSGQPKPVQLPESKSKSQAKSGEEKAVDARPQKVASALAKPTKIKSPSTKGLSNSSSFMISSDDVDDEKIVTLRRRSRPWRRKHDLSLRHQPLNETIAFISQDEMLSSNWNKTDEKLVIAASEEKYLRAVTSSDDADRAGGHVNILMAI